MINKGKFFTILSMGVLLISAIFILLASSAYSDLGDLPNLSRPEKTVIVPDRFLRRWDPVTVFFNSTVGPMGGGPEDNPEKFVTLSPTHPGAYRWLDEKTLQFRPAEPWPPLTRFGWKIQSSYAELLTLMSAPVSTVPHDNAENLDSVESVTLTFPEPVNPEALAKMITVELRPLPGVNNDKSIWLDHEDFDIKIIERGSRSDHSTYVIAFHEPIPGSMQARVRLRLSLADSVDEAFREIKFSTAESFRITQFGCTNQRYPVTVAGVSYDEEQAMRCSPRNSSIEVRFSAPLAEVDPIKARNLVRFTPAVEDLNFRNTGNTLTVTGSFESEVLYKVTLTPALIKDDNGRKLHMTGASNAFFFIPGQSGFLRWNTSQGIVERYGPKMVPLEGRGYERLDLRIYPIDPLDRSLWPFPSTPVSVDESARPPAPGEEPDKYTNPNRYISSHELSRQIKALGSPSVSELVDLPLRKGGRSAKFGLDLKPYLKKISGRNSPGSYLVGMRRIDSGSEREWIRIQVTDLSLTTIEESKKVKFVVTSLANGTPVGGAEISVEGSHNGKWVNIMSGSTNSAGHLTWDAPGYDRDEGSYSVRRIVVKKGKDILILDPTRAPERFSSNVWNQSSQTWLQWPLQRLYDPATSYRDLCHIFTERPVYKPEDEVHIKGYMRRHRIGELTALGGEGTVVVDGPGDLEWRYPLDITPQGSFYHKFEEEDLPTGNYRVHFVYKNSSCGSVNFLKESYRLPKFEVNLNGPQKVSLDSDFNIDLTATYYAGGRVASQPVRWRVTQFPYTWIPKKMKGFIYSNDARFSNQGRFRSTPAVYKESSTDDDGGNSIDIDPTIEQTAHARRYVIEATVTGADDQTVTNTHQVLALPPFVMGMKVPRYLEKADNIEPEIIVTGPDDKLMAGQEVKVRLLKRLWHSYLRANDFSTGEAKYITEVVDDEIFKTTITSTGKIQRLKLPADGAGVYIIELESRDKLGRTQVLTVDLFAGGDKPVTWSRPPTQVFTVSTDKKKYSPGETAVMILESPFQKARAIVVVEEPNGQNSYYWVDIRNGSGVFKLKVKKQHMPRLPVHFVLMRGRVEDGKPLAVASMDLGKPATLAASKWVEVTPAKHKVDVSLIYPEKAQPGDDIDIAINIKDDEGRPLSGEVTLWLVDQAVLALGKEQRLDPLPDFIVDRKSLTSLHDTRNLALGHLPFQENPGGDFADEEMEPASILDNVTIRKDFKAVPVYRPDIIIDKSGKAVIKVKLPDNLTNFKLRAKVISGQDRFGFAKGHLSVRLPVIVQPSLPRFVRPGDSFTATAIGRVVEGDGGKGRSEISLSGLKLEEKAKKIFQWSPVVAKRIDYRLSVPTPKHLKNGKIEREDVEVTVAVERTSDKARDAFSVKLPIRPDRKPVISSVIKNLKPGESTKIPAIREDVRPSTLKRSILLSNQPALVRMAAGLSYLLDYPHGCTEQRISRARAHIASKRFMDVLYQEGNESELQRSVNQTLDWIETVVGDNGLAAYWPGSRGYVSLTAWVVQFMVEARNAGFQVNGSLLDSMTDALEQSLRSDYAYYIRGESYAERTWALAALAAAGKIESGYAAELARRSDYLNLESLAQVAYVLSSSDSPEGSTLKALSEKIWRGIVIRLYQGKEVYGGLQQGVLSNNSLILPSETRTVSEVLRALSISDTMNMKKQLIADALVTLGQDDGWGNTNSNAAALLALSEFMTSDRSSDSTQNLKILMDKSISKVTLGKEKSMHHISNNVTGEIEVSFNDTKIQSPVVVRTETSYIPQADGSHVAAASNGFVVTRELQKVKGDGLPNERIKLDKPALTVELAVGDIIEEHIEVVNPQDRTYVAVVIPLAAGMEPLNPSLATAPPEAKPEGQLTLSPSYIAFMDDQMAFYYDSLPKGTYHFYFRTGATIPGTFIQPAAFSEMMYRQSINGNSNGSKVIITPKEFSNP